MPPRTTLAAIGPIAARCGVTRLADVTGLDTIGIPVFQAIRPAALSMSVSQGKGVTRVAARVSALMEAIELHCAEVIPAHSHGPPRAGDMMADGIGGAVEWCRATELVSGRATRVPHLLVSMDYTQPKGGIPIASSNGLASGNDRTEAIVAALCEVLERDAHSRWLGRPAAARQAAAIDPDTITNRAGSRMLRRIRAAGLGFRLWSFGEDHRVAAIACAIYEVSSGPAVVLPPTMGAGAHLEPAVALVRAVTEAAQIRATLIAGARDDLTPIDYADPAFLRLRFLIDSFGYGAARYDWSMLPSRSSGSLERDIDHLLAAAETVGTREIACVDLTPPDQPIGVVKILAPGFLGHAQPQHAFP